MAHRPALRARVAEAHVLEREPFADGDGHRPRIRRGDDLGLDLEEREEVVEVEGLARHLREADEEPLEQVAQPAERAGQEGEVADREVAAQRAPGDERVGHVVADGADGGEQAAPARAAGGQAAVGGVEGLGQRAVALDEERVQAEDLHFLRGLDAGPGLADVVELAPLRRPRVVERVALRVEVRLAEERGHERQHQQRDQPRRVDQQAGGEARDGHHVLGLAEDLAHQRGAAHGLAPRAVQAVLQLAVLEVLEVEGGRVLHEADAGGVGEPLGEQRVQERDDAAEHVGEHGQRQLDAEQDEEVVDEAAGQPFAEAVLRRGPRRRAARPRR